MNLVIIVAAFRVFEFTFNNAYIFLVLLQTIQTQEIIPSGDFKQFQQIQLQVSTVFEFKM